LHHYWALQNGDICLKLLLVSPSPRPHRDPLQHPALQGIRVVQHGIGLNFILVIVKGTAGILGNSYALVADAIESASDVLSSFLVWIGLRTAAKPPDANHPYGHGKAEPVAAIMVSLLLVAAAVLIVVESIHNIRTPHALPKAWTLIVLALVVVGKELIFRYVMRTAKNIKSTAVSGEATHHRADAITSITAFVGICIALWGGPGYEVADDWAAIIAGLFIAWNAWTIFQPAFSELMDEAVDGNLVNEIRELGKAVPGVEDIDKCFVRKMGFELFVDIHVVVAADMTVKQGHDIAHAVKNHIMQKKLEVYDVLTHIEPHEN
jgi:cation diffusion facilitator family transporter